MAGTRTLMINTVDFGGFDRGTTGIGYSGILMMAGNRALLIDTVDFGGFGRGITGIGYSGRVVIIPNRFTTRG